MVPYDFLIIAFIFFLAWLIELVRSFPDWMEDGAATFWRVVGIIAMIAMVIYIFTMGVK